MSNYKIKTTVSIEMTAATFTVNILLSSLLSLSLSLSLSFSLSISPSLFRSLPLSHERLVIRTKSVEWYKKIVTTNRNRRYLVHFSY